MKVSICIPVYNVEKYIRRCLESLLNQTYHDLEIIIVNDSTPDNSMSIVCEYAEIDHRIVVLNHEHNRGLMEARRTAYMKATGDYITFLDSDDYLPENSIETLVNCINLTGADVVSGLIEYISDNEERSILPNMLRYGEDKVSVLKSLLKKEFGHNLCSKIFKRELLQQNEYKSYCNILNGEDALLFYQIVDCSTKIVQISNVVYYYCQNIQSSTQVRLSEQGVKSILMANKIIKEICYPYSQLYNLLYNYISLSIITLYLNRYIEPKLFKQYVYDNELEEFIKVRFLARYLSFKNAMTLIYRAFICLGKDIFKSKLKG